MMSPRDILIGSTVLLASIVLINAFECPDYCTCSVTQDSVLQNHAKCESLEGLKIDGKHIPLHSIDLSNTSIARITNHLEKFRDLNSLDLSNNRLSEVGKLGRRIKVLNLSHNKITSGKLSKIPSHVENLDLSYNEITYLPLELKKLNFLKSIELTGNSINCTCETLEVRNWLQENHVWTDNHIKCSYPIEVKGQPWLQVKQSDICGDQVQSPRSIPLNQDITTDDDNELMLGDQPIENEGSGLGIDDELEKDFLPVDEKKEKKANETVDLNVDDEGSGDLFTEADIEKDSSSVATNATSSDEVEAHIPEVGSGDNELEEDEQGRLMDDDEGSGSGMGIYIPKVDLGIESSTNVAFENSANDDEHDENTPVAPPQEAVTESSSDIFGPGLGIKEPVTEAPVSEESVVAVNLSPSGNQPGGDQVDGPVEEETLDSEQNSKIVVSEKIGNIEEANTGAGKNTYILLAVVLVLLVVLILFVAIKRRRMSQQRDRDAENPRSTELVDMNKKNLGKPINKNGASEHIPLMGDRTKEDLAKPINGEKKTPYKTSDEADSKAQEPLLSEQPNKPESNNNVALAQAEQPNAQIPEPIHKPNSQTLPPNSSLPAGDDEVFLPSSSPSSPKASRYSPVYSPETGRVKIKLLETPKPKTPLLVTRSRSNAGDVITTPNGNSLRAPDHIH